MPAVTPAPRTCWSKAALSTVEVADSSLAHDRGPKLALYARHGVPEVWIVDLVDRAVEFFRALGPEDCTERHQATGGFATPIRIPGLAIDVAALLLCRLREADRTNEGLI